MKFSFLVLFALLFTSCASAQNKSPQPKALIELFTSEGCSSCPPAEELLQQMQAENPDLLILSYHVDYWDRLGWKDPFSKPEWTRRQNEYATVLHTNNLYTPQAVVNGRGHVTGSNRTGISELLKKYPLAQNEAPVQLRTSFKEGICSVAYEVLLSAGEILQIALVKRQATTTVKKGENGGRTLRHTNVVISLRSVDKAKGQVDFSLPAGSAASEYAVIAFVQDTESKKIQRVIEVSL